MNFDVIKNLSRVISIAAVVSFFAFTASAQETVSEAVVNVVNANGEPIDNANVIIRNPKNGFQRSKSSGKSGEYNFSNLPVGNSYTVIVEAQGARETQSNLVVSLGQKTNAFIVLGGSSQEMEEVVVMGRAIDPKESVAVGPSAVFGLEQIQNAPAINRNITDIIRADPRIYVDEAQGSQNPVQCGGKSPRFNSTTLDGVPINDSFGLNSNGYPTERVPFPFDAIRQTSVELAPFDVEYGRFTACNINSVTKSGENTFHGGLFYDYSSDSFRGDSLEGERLNLPQFDENRYGINFGGPILQDTLFFFVAYEKQEGVNTFDRGPIGSGAIDIVDITQGELDEIARIAQERYNYDVGGIPNSRDTDDEKVLVKLDWNISEQHRAEFTYMYNEGFNTVQSDGDLNEFEFANHLYERGTELKSTSFRFYSDWTDRFSTEMRIGYIDVDNRQEPINGTDFGEIRVETDEVDVYLGADDSRHANDLNYDNLIIVLKGKYNTDSGHSFSFGYEREDLNVFNLFVQHVETEIRFDGIENFRNGFADAIFYNNSPTGNPQDAAADWGYAIDTVYFQDEFDISERISISAGLRYDRYSTSDAPPRNAQFAADYGFDNTSTLDGEDLLQPRFGFNFDVNDSISINGGIGLYSGGNPNVWLSNTFSANNVAQFGQRGRGFGYTDGSRSLFDSDVVYVDVETGAPSGPGYGVPQELFDAVAAGRGDNFEINYLDPNFKIPSEWKFALGGEWITSADYIWRADFLYSRGQDSAVVKRGDLERVGTTADGYPQYRSVREPSFVLTNSSKGNRALSASLAVSKAYENGLDWALAYAYTDAEDINPMTSSVAFSNYVNRAFFDPQEEVLSTSNFNIKHRVTLRGNYRHTFVKDYATIFSLYGTYNSGRPFSVGFNGTRDPYRFTPFLDFQNNVLRPGARRNDRESKSWTKLDLKITQELPGFSAEHRSKFFIVIDNLTNLINDDWGILEEVSFPRLAREGDDSPQSRVGDASLWQIRIGVEYDF